MSKLQNFLRQTIRRHYYTIVLASVWLLISLGACSTKRNDSASRFYHNLTTRYNVYYNGDNAYDQGYKDLYLNIDESYSEPLTPDPITRQGGTPTSEGTQEVSGSFGKAIEKGRKAIREHSIRTKPKVDRMSMLRDPKAKAFYDKTEFNTFLHNAWFLVGKSQFYAGHFSESMATFSYISRLYATDSEIRDEARIWQARCYTALGWTVESQEILDGLPSDGLYLKKSQAYHLAQAELALKSDRHRDAIPYLQTAVRRTPNRIQRARLNYLIGQLHSEVGESREAKRAFRRTIRLSPPYPLEFAATLRELELEAKQSPDRVIRQLDRLALRSKNKDLLDQIYLAQGLLYLKQQDTLRAIKSFAGGADRSTAKSFDYMLCQLHLGEIYLAQNDYLKAQKAYAAANGVINRSHPDYDRVSKLSTDLDQLVSFAEQVAEQDSLRRVAAMPQEARLALVDSLISAYQKEQKEAARQAALAEQESRNSALNEQADATNPNRRTSVASPTMGGGNGKFYFYNPQLVAQGKDAFERKWGKRPLADDWRRRDKSLAFDASTTADDVSVPTDSLSNQDQTSAQDSLPADQDPTKREYYLSKLPKTPEQIAASDEIIQTALVGMARAFNEQMERLNESAGTYQDLLRRYPNYSDRVSVYYTLYMLYQRMERADLAEPWRQKLLTSHPQDPLAKTLSNPDYIATLRANVGADERLYKKALEAYLKGDARIVQQLYRQLSTDYPLSDIQPQFAFINALSQVLLGNEQAFRTQLESLVSTFPKESVSTLAQEMLSQLQRGRHISQGGYSGLAWDSFTLPSTIDSAKTTAPYAVGLSTEPHHALLFYPTQGTAQTNALRFAIESFNFSTFTDYILPVSIEPRGTGLLASIDDLPTASIAWQYLSQAYTKGYMPAIDCSAILIAISRSNYDKMMHGGQSLEHYMTFVADSLLDRYPQALPMIERWISLTSTQDSIATVDTAAQTPQAPLTFEILRPSITLPNVVVEVDSLIQQATPLYETTPESIHVNAPRQLTPEDIKQMEQNRKKEEKALEQDRKAKLKEQEARRKAEIKAREQERKRQEELRREQIKEVEAKRKAQEKARREQIRRQEKERKERLKAIEEERRRKLKERY